MGHFAFAKNVSRVPVRLTLKSVSLIPVRGIFEVFPDREKTREKVYGRKTPRSVQKTILAHTGTVISYRYVRDIFI
jgi:hypothetical protein